MTAPGEPTPCDRARGVALLTATASVIRKDLLLEWRGRARINATLFFAIMTLLLFSFAVGPETKSLAQNAAGYLWLAILLSSVLSLGESFRIENENGALEGLRLIPVDARAIFLGKAIANLVLLTGLGVLLIPIAVALYGAEISAGFPRAVLVLVLGCAAISAPGTLYAAIANQARARDVLLPLLLFPILVPALVGAVKATQLVFQGDPMGQLDSWTTLLVIFNLMYWLLCLVLFGRVVEE
ncbi:MAG: heme exporter protein CcmB [Deltaproteobacteria bacterium]|nr:heme exporter protein CcmB [Deltaproteobacteria bacterium]